MKVPHRISLSILAAFLVLFSYAQTPFTNCSAAFLNNKIIVDEYSPEGQCVLDSTAKGELTVATAELSPTSSIAVDKIKFKIAIRDQHTKTITMYSDETFKQVNIQKIMAKARKGDSIVLLTLDNEYALPHNEIRIN